MRSCIRLFAAFALFQALPALAQPHLLGVLGGSAQQAADAGAVVEIDPSTGGATVLATPLPGEGLTGIAALPTGRVYVCTSDFIGPARLLEIDPQTGALVADVGALTDGVNPLIFHDLTADPTTGVLYGVSVGANLVSGGRTADGAGSTNAIFTIDPATAVATFVATPSPLTGNFLAIAFASDGVLWGKVNNAPELYEIDKSTGAILSTVALSPSLGGLGFGNAGDDTFYMPECCDGIPGNVLYRVDLAGNATLIGPAGGTRRVHDVAVAGRIPPVVEIPTLGVRELAVLAAVLLALGCLRIARRRRAPAGSAARR